jgi:hypothetical protein
LIGVVEKRRLRYPRAMTAAHALCCHPTTPCDAVRVLAVAAGTVPDGGLQLFYRLAGDLARLRIPKPGEPLNTDGLWRHTCLEAFIGSRGTPAYREFNFSPSGAWAAYAFAGYREGMTPLEMPLPGIALQLSEHALELAVRLPAEALPVASPRRLGLSAVIETVDAVLSYWALRHAAERPDFHHPDSFILDLP